MKFLVSIILGFALLHASSGCRDGWVKFGESCYLLALQTASWPEAEAYCMAVGGGLAELETEVESDFLENTLRERHINDSDVDASYWIGGNDIEVEGRFHWYRSNKPLAYTDWAPSQPDNAFSGENCMELQGIFTHHWNDRNCNDKEHFICEVQDIGSDPIIG